MRAIGFAIVLLLGLTAGGPQQLVPLPPVTHVLSIDKPEWRDDPATAPSGGMMFFALDRLIVAGSPYVYALDLRGKLRWKVSADAIVVHVGDEALAYDGDGGTLLLRDIRTGALRWKQTVCPLRTPATNDGRVGTIAVHGDAFLIGCRGGRLVRVDRQTGRILQSSDAFVASMFFGIRPLGSCAYGLSGSSSGAIGFSQIAIVDCRTLRPIMAETTNAGILGAVGNTAIIVRSCCFGQPDGYQPATIYRVDLANGSMTSATDLRPDPGRFPANSPIGQPANVFLEGRHLMVSVDRSLYDYGDALGTLTRYRHVRDDYKATLAQWMPVSGNFTNAVNQVETSTDPRQRVNMYSRPDGAHVTVGLGCAPIASNALLLIVGCGPGGSIWPGPSPHIAAYRWKH